MPKYTFRTKTETYYGGHLVKKGVIVETSKELSKQYPEIFELIGAENDVKAPEKEEAAKDEKAGEPETEDEKPEESEITAEDKADEASAEDKKPTNPTVDNMTRKELLDLAEALHIEGASKMNAGQLKKACKEVLESK